MESSSVPTDAELHALARQAADEVLRQKLMLVTAESCTGGWIAKTLTDIPGSSAWFDAGVVTYSYEAKEALLGVNPRTLEHDGAVSEETALEMVSGALARFGAGVAVAVTGIAGPSGGTPEKPVGTVWIGWKRRGGYAHARLYRFAGDRDAVRRQTVAAALAGLRKTLTE
jgi:nicotinamide-nucleotide amidase